MRISDWSSDVCSSDLRAEVAAERISFRRDRALEPDLARGDNQQLAKSIRCRGDRGGVNAACIVLRDMMEAVDAENARDRGIASGDDRGQFARRQFVAGIGRLDRKSTRLNSSH